MPVVYARPPIWVINMVYLCVTEHPIHLGELRKRLGPRATYNPKLFPPVILRWADLYRPNSVISVSVYSTGKMVCAGAKVEHQANHIVHEILSYLPVNNDGKVDMSLQNVVCTTCLPFRLNLKKMAREDPSYASLSKMFPGLCLRRPEAKGAVLMCFETGKVNITGGKSKAEADYAFSVLFDYLCRFEYRPEEEELVDTEEPLSVGKFDDDDLEAILREDMRQLGLEEDEKEHLDAEIRIDVEVEEVEMASGTFGAYTVTLSCEL
jgi:TATA-box binding protein (TBP) (component of TFIID and TFIIIB)